MYEIAATGAMDITRQEVTHLYCPSTDEADGDDSSRCYQSAWSADGASYRFARKETLTFLDFDSGSRSPCSVTGKLSSLKIQPADFS